MTAMEKYDDISGDDTPEVYSDAYASVGDSIQLYLQDIGKTPLLTAEQEVELSQRIEVGLYADQVLGGNVTSSADTSVEELEWFVRDGKEAFDHMINANLRLAVSVAKKYKHSDTTSFDQSDRMQEANLGLHRAVQKFDYQKGFKFSTYATWWIRQSVSRGAHDQSSTIRYPAHVGEKMNKLRNIERQLASELEHDPSDQELADGMNIPIEQLLDLKSKIHKIISMNAILNVDGGAETEFGDLITDNVESVEDQVLSSLQHHAIINLIDIVLDYRSGEVIRMRYGIESDKTHTLDEIGERFGLTRERIRQIQNQALHTLRTVASLDQF